MAEPDFLRGRDGRHAHLAEREGVTFAAQAAKLRLFAGAPDLAKPILVLAPHPDDAEIAAFGLYANRNASVVTVTAGNAGSPTYEAVFDDPADQYLFKGRIRLIDSITIPWQGSIPPERAFNMGYFDARLAEMHEKRDAVIPEMYRPNTDINVYRRENIGSLLPLRPRDSKWSNLVDDMLALLKKVKPAVIAAPHPQLDTHRDHQYTTVALVRSAGSLEQPRHASALHEPCGSQPVSVRPCGHADVPTAAAAGRRRDSTASIRTLFPRRLQRLKLFALESMHDLRFTPTRQYQLAREDARASRRKRPGRSPTSRTCAADRDRTSCSTSTTETASTTMVKDFLAREAAMTATQ